MRKEIKYQFPLGINNNITNYLLINSCKKIYKPRLVSSIYYDDDRLSLFYETANGINLREKLRCRFYDNGKDGFKIEKKSRFNEFNKKDFLNNNDFKKEKFRRVEDLIFNIDNESKISVPSVIFDKYYPKVLVNYKRIYLLTPCLKARITIDTKINFSKLLVKNNTIHTCSRRFLEHNILEIKFPDDKDSIIKLISKVVDKFDLNYSKCSKYSKAIEGTF
tara:strand:- start:2469 stop:3128 length:660 start_codon:yes stop_codon:yes gene_type:complete